MTASPSIDPARLLSEQLAQASPDLLRELLTTVINGLMAAEADAVCGAEYGTRSEQRTNRRNGYRHRDFDTRAGTLDVAVPKLRQGVLLPSQGTFSQLLTRPGKTEATARPSSGPKVTPLMTTASASTDDLGRAGRQIAAQCGNTGSAAGPYPGSFYSVPLTLLLLAIGLATAAALMAVVRRPRDFAPDDIGDDELRHRSTTRVLAAAGAAVAASHLGIAFFAGTALLRLDCQRAWMGPAAWALVASVPAALLVLGWCLVLTLDPSTQTTRPRRTSNCGASSRT